MAAASTAGLVPITRSYLAKFYDKYPYTPACPDISFISARLRDRCKVLEDKISEADAESVASLEFPLPHKIDENFWRNREQIEEMQHLLETNFLQSTDPAIKDIENVLMEIVTSLKSLSNEIEQYQRKSSEKVFDMVMTYMPQDFRGSLIKQQRERSERRRQSEVQQLLDNGGSIQEKYALLWRQQMDRRRQLAQLGSATGVYKTIVTYLVGVPQVLLDFVCKINDHNGPMEEQRVRYGPPLHQLTSLSISIRIFLFLWSKFFNDNSLNANEFVSLLEEAVQVYVTEFKQVFDNSPFLITAEEARTAEGIEQIDDFKETIIATGRTHEVILSVECAGSLVAWDFCLTSGKDVGFTVEYIDDKGAKVPMLPYLRCESNQGSFYSPSIGSYKLVWDNSYSTFNRKFLRYKVDTIPPVIDPPPPPPDSQNLKTEE